MSLYDVKRAKAVYRYDDAGATWCDIGTATGLPADFGFPLVDQ